MDIEELIWKLIDITDIKKEYLMELNEILDEEAELLRVAMEDQEGSTLAKTSLSFKETQEAIHKVQRMLLNLDEEFLACMNELKEEGDVVSIAELDGHRYTRLRDLQKQVEAVMHIETLHSIKKKEVHDLKTQWLMFSQEEERGYLSTKGIGTSNRASEAYKKAQSKPL